MECKLILNCYKMKIVIRTIKNKIIKYISIPLKRWRKSKIQHFDFSIISNNCWGGGIYEKLNLEYRTPTVGLFFFAEDYIRFLENLEYYLGITPVVIQRENSKYLKELNEKHKYDTFSIGKIDDIEVIFLHYANGNEAIAKWERRKKRLNKEKLIIKFNDQNECTYQHLQRFEQLQYQNKICFTAKKYAGCSTTVCKNNGSNIIKNDMNFFTKPINMINFINNITYDKRNICN